MVELLEKLKSEAIDGSQNNADPFLSERVPIKTGEWVDIFKGYPEKYVIRNYHLESEQEGRNMVGKLKCAITRLGEYKINVPESQFVIGQEGGQLSLYIIVERIHGPKLDELIQRGEAVTETKHFSNELLMLFEQLVNYYTDEYNLNDKSGAFMSDIARLDQYIFGNLIGQGAEKIYLVDLDPAYLTESRSDRQNYLDWFICLEEFAESLQLVEKNLPGFSCAEIKGRLRSFLDAVDYSIKGKYSDNIQRIKKLLR